MKTIFAQQPAHAPNGATIAAILTLPWLALLAGFAFIWFKA
jgi:hypothetical protein